MFNDANNWLRSNLMPGARKQKPKLNTSFGPRTDAGAKIWDTGLTIVATARKLGANVLDYFRDRISRVNQMPGLLRNSFTVQQASIREQLGIVLQDTFRFSGPVMENIRYGRLDATDEEVIAAARLANADRFIRLLPQRCQTQVSEQGHNFSH